MPEFFDSSQAQCDQHPSTNIDSQQLSPPLSLSPNDSPSKTNELFGDEPDPSCLVSTSPLCKRVVTHQCCLKSLLIRILELYLPPMQCPRLTMTYRLMTCYMLSKCPDGMIES